MGNSGSASNIRWERETLMYPAMEKMGEYFCAAEGNYGGLIDRSGNWIIKVSLLDHLDD